MQATVFIRNNEGITDLTNITIPLGTKNIIFRNNDIAFVPAEYFTGLPNVHKIDLHTNQIVDVQDNSFSQVPSLNSPVAGGPK